MADVTDKPLKCFRSRPEPGPGGRKEVTVMIMIVLIAALQRWWDRRQAKQRTTPVMTERGDQRAAAAGGRDRLRASRADRERVIELLKVAFVQDRLTQDELDTRVGLALASRTYAELATLTADIPAGSAAAPPPVRPARDRARSQRYQGYKLAGVVFAVLSAYVLAGLESGAENPVEGLVGWVVSTAFCAVVLGALLLLHSRLDKHAGPIPPGPDPGGPGLEGQQRTAIGP